MPRPRDRDLFLTQLTECGGRSGNRTLQTKLGWTDTKYEKIRKILLNEGMIEKGRGYGGSVLLVDNTTVPIVPAQSNAKPQKLPSIEKEAANLQAAITAERELYKPILKQLEVRWSREWDLAQSHFEITAQQGRRDTGGSWSRPDLVAIGYKNYEFLPDKVLEIFTFEIKASNDVSIKGVMEALAHREAATRSYVIYHTYDREFSEYTESERIEELAARHGVGVYAAKQASDFDQWTEIVSAQRASPDPEKVDGFIRRSISDPGKTKIRKWF